MGALEDEYKHNIQLISMFREEVIALDIQLPGKIYICSHFQNIFFEHKILSIRNSNFVHKWLKVYF